MGFKKGNKLAGKRGPDLVSKAEKRNLVEFIKEAGAQRFIQEMQSLEGKEYCRIYIGAVEIAFPKLSRQEHTGKDGKDLFPKPIMDVE